MAAPNKNRKPVERQIQKNRILYICPKCKQIWTQKRKSHRSLCMNCGQYLDWTNLDIVDAVYLVCQNMEEAYYSARQYEDICKTAYGLDLDNWRLKSDRCWPKELYFPFLERKDYGRFMRWAAKEGLNIVKE